MDTLRIDICYRPLRVGWAVRRGDFESLRRIVRWSHTLWGGRHNPIVVVDDAEHAKRIVETFRVDLVWSVGSDESVRTFPTRFPYLISPFYDEALTVRGMHEHQAQFLDIHNTLIAMGNDGATKNIRQKGFRAYSWDGDDALADLLLIQMGAYPGVDEVGIDYRAIVNDALEPQEIALPTGGRLSADLLEYPTISSLPRHKMGRHYSVPGGWDYPGFVVGDVADFDDLVAYWNLRAADIPMWFVDPIHLERFAEIIPAWEKHARGLITNMPDQRGGLAVWTRRDDHQSIQDLFGGRMSTSATFATTRGTRALSARR